VNCYLQGIVCAVWLNLGVTWHWHHN